MSVFKPSDRPVAGNPSGSIYKVMGDGTTMVNSPLPACPAAELERTSRLTKKGDGGTDRP